MAEFADGGPIRATGKTRIWFMPVDSDVLATDGGLLWYGTPDDLGSTADMSKVFVPGSLKFESSKACVHCRRYEPDHEPGCIELMAEQVERFEQGLREE